MPDDWTKEVLVPFGTSMSHLQRNDTSQPLLSQNL